MNGLNWSFNGMKINWKGYLKLGIATTFMAFLVIGISATFVVEGQEAGEALGIFVGVLILFIPAFLFLTNYIKHVLKQSKRPPTRR